MTPENQHEPSMPKPQQIGYRDWTILAFPTANGYQPLCIASLADFWSDEKCYSTPEGAIAVGKRFIDSKLDRREVA